ncbi:hypothetical protein F5Y16DRAFT_375900 [Xylariaceae sp. FL0255]|nr:hypothetical protein F5Y16DRAFT_375900 [Xylariaceae sp. FL0255]
MTVRSGASVALIPCGLFPPSVSVTSCTATWPRYLDGFTSVPHHLHPPGLAYVVSGLGICGSRRSGSLERKVFCIVIRTIIISNGIDELMW